MAQSGWEETPAQQEATIEAQPAEAKEFEEEVKLFGKWTYSDLEVRDTSLTDYISIFNSRAKTFVPHTAGRWQKKRFRKAACPIIERLVNSLMMHGRNTGKKLMAVRIVKHTLEIIHLLTGENPIQVVINAVSNAGPREDSTRIGTGGVARRQAVDVSPLRRVNTGIYLICAGARASAFRNVKTIAECLADEIMNAAKGSANSYAIKKKDEIERIAKGNR
ncbi:unnamed protein product [Blepharisma stoltei]|uniref:Small ribosomal subunit protein uS7 domain-containing protein n=1 Tax=Blepharisma stoltei TaxID=1481888 RepID=A0AAU9JWB0_9CILI|nr:unnamed protein product [Blepharisma stoltei]